MISISNATGNRKPSGARVSAVDSSGSRTFARNEEQRMYRNLIGLTLLIAIGGCDEPNRGHPVNASNPSPDLNALVWMVDGSAHLVSGNGMTRSYLVFGEGARWLPGIGALADSDGAILHGFSPSQFSISDVSSATQNWFESTREDWTVSGISENGRWLALFNVSEPELLIVDVAKIAVAARLSADELRQVTGAQVERTFAPPVGVAVPDTGNEFAVCLPTSETAGGSAEDPILATYVVNIKQMKGYKVGYGSPVAWLPNSRLLCERFDERNSAEFVSRVVVYDQMGRTVWEVAGFAHPSYNGKHVIASKEIGNEENAQRKFELRKFDASTGESIARLEFAYDYAIDYLIALPDVLPSGWNR